MRHSEYTANQALASTVHKPAAHMPTRAEVARHAARQTRKPATRGHGEMFAALFVSAVVPAVLFALSAIGR